MSGKAALRETSCGLRNGRRQAPRRAASARRSTQPAACLTQHPPRRGGFTLIEVLGAVAILGIGAAGGAAAWSACAEMTRSARAMQAQTQVIEQELERVRRLNWDGLDNTRDWVEHMAYDVEGNPLGPARTTRPSGHGYISFVKVEPLAEEALSLGKKRRVDWVARPALRQVTVRVRAYPLDAARPPAVEMVTYLAPEGL